MENKDTRRDETNNKLAIKINSKSNTKSFKFVSNTLKFPKNLPCQINNLEIFLNVIGGQENGGEKTEQEGMNYNGGISGVFYVPKKKVSIPFGFKIPFSIKFNTAVALSFSTKQSESTQITQLNKFVFGDENVKPIVLTKEVAFDIAFYLISEMKGFDKFKEQAEKVHKFIESNEITLNFLIDHSEQKYHVGFYWKDFVLDGMPKEIKIQDIMFGLSLNLKPESKNPFALKIGGKGSFGNDHQNRLYIEYELDSYEQRLEFGGTLSSVTSLLNKMSVKIPQQFEEFAKDTTISIEWISDIKKNITEDMKLAEQ